MAFVFQKQYPPEVEARMRSLYESLSEKDRRRFAAFEAERLGHGGIEYISGVLGCSKKTIENGLAELDDLADDPAAGRVRRPGGGRKERIAADPRLEENLTSLLDARTAGDPDDEETLFTDLSPRTLAEKVTDMGTPVSPHTIDAWLDELGMGLRKIQKTMAVGESPDRDAQFRRIEELMSLYWNRGNPVFSIDTKAKEHLGFLYRAGRVRSEAPQVAYDHDFSTLARGVVIPHGLFDVFENGHINLGLSHDTTEFACDSFRWYWNEFGRKAYPKATSILWLCDCGGSNAANKHLFKQDLQDLVNDIGIEIRVAHYPSYCSKYNPIERRFFSHVGRACQGFLFDTLETVVRLMKNTSTRAGLSATVNILEGAYETGRKASEEFKAAMPILFDALLGKWNYRAVPQQ